MSSSHTTELIRPSEPLFDEARLAAAGFLARCSGTTRLAYSSDLRLRFAWSHDRRLQVLGVQRPHLELWAREMEERLARATVGRRLSTVAGMYRFGVIDGRLDRNPAGESTTLGLDRGARGGRRARGRRARRTSP